MGRETYTRGDGTSGEVFGAVTYTQTTVSVLDSSTTLLAANDLRKFALFVDLGTTRVDMSVDGTAALTTDGIPLLPNGGYYIMSAANDNLTYGAITGISSVTGQSVRVIEGV